MPLNAAIVGASAEPVVHAIDARWLMAYAAGLGETLPCYLDTRQLRASRRIPCFRCVLNGPLSWACVTMPAPSA